VQLGHSVSKLPRLSLVVLQSRIALTHILAVAPAAALCAYRLRFVKLFYEFAPSCLYSDTRGGVSA
jgi:hypothetical protein